MPGHNIPGLYVDRARSQTLQDGDRLAVINRDPSPDETGVPRAATVTVEIVDIGDPAIGIIETDTLVWIGGVLAWNGDEGARPGFSGDATITSDTYRLVLSRDADFSSEEEVEIRVQSGLVDESEWIDVTYSFTAEDYTAPSLVAAQATAQTTVRLSFNEAVVVVDAEGFAFEALDAPAVPIAATAAVADGTAVDVTTDIAMSPDAQYRATATGIEDAAGNPIGTANTAAFAGFRVPRPATRRFDIWTTMVPAKNRREDATGELRSFVDCLQDVTDLLLADIDRFDRTWDIERASSTFLELILADLGNPFDFGLSVAQKRRLAGMLVDLYRQKGLAAGIINAVRFFVGIEVTIDPLREVTMDLGVSELGVDWELGSGDTWMLFAFAVVSPVSLTDAQLDAVTDIAEHMKPAHTHLARVVEPEVPEDVDHWLIGVSEIGEETELH